MREKCVVTNRGVYMESSSMNIQDNNYDPIIKNSEQDILIKNRIRELCETCEPSNFYPAMRKLMDELKFNINDCMFVGSPGRLKFNPDYSFLNDYITKHSNALMRELATGASEKENNK